MPRGAVIGLLVGLALAAGAWLVTFVSADGLWAAVLGGLAWTALGALAGSILGSLFAGGPERTDDPEDEATDALASRRAPRAPAPNP